MRYVPDFVGQASKLAKMNPKRFGASHIRTVEEQSLPIITGCQDFFALGRNFNLSPLFRQRRRRLFQKSSSLHKRSRKKRTGRERRRNGPSQFYWHWLKVISKAAYRADSQPSKKKFRHASQNKTAFYKGANSKKDIFDLYFNICPKRCRYLNISNCNWLTERNTLLVQYPSIFYIIILPLRWKMGQGSKIFGCWCVW